MNKASGCDRIPAEPFKIIKLDTVKVLHSKCQQIWKTQQWPQDQKRPVFDQGSPKMAEEQDGETTFSRTNSSKEHLTAE